LAVVGGAVVGGVVSYVIVRVTSKINDPMIEITLSTIAAYGSFAAAESLHGSGVIATVVAGLVLGTAGRTSAFSAEARTAADAFWQYVAFGLNSVVFLLIGFEALPVRLLSHASVVAIAFVTVVAARFVVVLASAAYCTKRKSEFRFAGWCSWRGAACAARYRWCSRSRCPRSFLTGSF